MTGLTLMPTLASSLMDDFWVGVALMIVGMVIVFIALVLVGVVISGSSALARMVDGEQTTGDLKIEDEEYPMPTPGEEAVSSPAEPSIPLVAIVTAAAVAALGRSVRVVGITRVSEPSSAWTQMGRSTIHSSHNLRRNP